MQYENLFLKLRNYIINKHLFQNTFVQIKGHYIKFERTLNIITRRIFKIYYI